MSDTFFHSLAGTVLLAHPALTGDTFYRSVVFLSAHTQSDGALGFVLNAPVGKNLCDLQNEFTYGPLAHVPLFRGGPVQEQQLMFAVMQLEGDGPLLRVGLESAEAESLVIGGSPNTPVYAFLGYSGWSAGQLEAELRRDTWVTSSVDVQCLRQYGGHDLWRRLLLKAAPELAYLADAPLDPSMN